MEGARPVGYTRQSVWAEHYTAFKRMDLVFKAKAKYQYSFCVYVYKRNRLRLVKRFYVDPRIEPHKSKHKQYLYKKLKTLATECNFKSPSKVTKRGVRLLGEWERETKRFFKKRKKKR